MPSQNPIVSVDDTIVVYPRAPRTAYRCLVCDEPIQRVTVGVAAPVNAEASGHAYAFCCLKHVAELRDVLSAVPEQDEDYKRIRVGAPTTTIRDEAFYCPACCQPVSGTEPFCVLGTLHCHVACTDALADALSDLHQHFPALLGYAL